MENNLFGEKIKETFSFDNPKSVISIRLVNEIVRLKKYLL